MFGSNGSCVVQKYFELLSISVTAFDFFHICLPFLDKPHGKCATRQIGVITRSDGRGIKDKRGTTEP